MRCSPCACTPWSRSAPRGRKKRAVGYGYPKSAAAHLNVCQISPSALHKFRTAQGNNSWRYLI